MSQPLTTSQPYAHIEQDEAGNPVISGSTMKVVELVMAQQAHGWSPEELHFQHPDISLAEIYSALAFYWDHKDELDADIARRSAYVDKMHRAAALRRASIANDMLKNVKIIVEKHPDTYVAYPVGLKGVVIGQGETYDEALADVRSAIAFHVDTFGASEFEQEDPVLEAFVTETAVSV
jgi:uncharacterized protein (DUF433 family)/predicted RNase H-like HicB family nuclease